MIPYYIAVAIEINKKETNVIRRYTRLNIDDTLYMAAKWN